jgi:hypothetical protein
MKVCSRKECSHKGKPQSSDSFYPNDQLRDGLHSHCKTCVKEARARTHAKKKKLEWWNIIIG